MDNTLVWQRTINFRNANSLGKLCGAADFVDHMIPVSIDLPNHVSPTLTLTITSNLDGPATDESFGIANVKISPLTPAWPEPDIFETNTAPAWTGTGTAATLFSCGIQGVLLGGVGNAIAGSTLTRGKILATATETRSTMEFFFGEPLALSSSLSCLHPTAVYTNLPAHSGLRVKMQLFYLDGPWQANEVVQIFLDGVLLWSAGPPATSTNLCGGAAADVMVYVDANLDPHISSTATLTVRSTLASNSPARSFALAVRTSLFWGLEGR